MYQRKPDWYKPELYDDETVEEALQNVYATCCEMCGTPDQQCPDIDISVDHGASRICMPDLILELWRRLDNAKNELRELKNVTKENED